jgi:hypothetical protein
MQSSSKLRRKIEIKDLLDTVASVVEVIFVQNMQMLSVQHADKKKNSVQKSVKINLLKMPYHLDTYGLPFLNKLQLFRRIFLLLFSRHVEGASEIHATNYIRIRGVTDGGLSTLIH